MSEDSNRRPEAVTCQECGVRLVDGWGYGTGPEGEILCYDNCFDDYAEANWGYERCHLCNGSYPPDQMVGFEGERFCTNDCLIHHTEGEGERFVTRYYDSREYLGLYKSLRGEENVWIREMKETILEKCADVWIPDVIAFLAVMFTGKTPPKPEWDRVSIYRFKWLRPPSARSAEVRYPVYN